MVVAKAIQIDIGVESRKSPAQVKPRRIRSGVRFVAEVTGLDLR